MLPRPRPSLSRSTLAASGLAALALATAPSTGCGADESASPTAAATTTSATTTSATGAGGAGGVGGSGGAGGSVEPPACDGAAPFSDGPYGTASRDLADDFTVPTLDGDWSFSDHWTGCDSYLFANYAAGYQYAEDLWASSTTKLLKSSPKNVHYFFMSYADDDATATADVQTLKDKLDVSLAGLSPEDQATFQGHFHFVTTGARHLGNWISDMLTDKGVFAFGIDRFQRIREVGLLFSAASSSQKAKLDYLTHEADHYNFEWDRELALANETATVIPVLEGETQSFDVDVTLPDAATMATFDTLELDLSLSCTDHEDANCGAWDYIANLFLCDEADPTSCPTEVGRWITTYGREGRWVTDASSLLALLKAGGTRRFHLNPANSYVVDLSFRLSNRNKGMRPDEAVFLFSGGPFNETYSDNYPPYVFDVPADVKKVEIAGYITGHGWGAEADNCAEFCNHEHHFEVNGTDFVKDHPMAGTSAGCLDQVPDGVVPNQYGTWVLGRGGWCPGLDVKLWTADVTSAVDVGGTNTLVYQGLFKGAPYVPKPGDPNSGGFGANITMSSWLVYWR